MPTQLPLVLRIGLCISGAALIINLAAAVCISAGFGDESPFQTIRLVTMWLLLLPIAAALVQLGALRTVSGRWHVLALVLCGLGDGIGSLTANTTVLLSFFSVAHLSYLCAYWPSRRRSLAHSHIAYGYASVGLAAGTIIAINAGALAVPVIIFALLLAAVAAMAALDTVGLFGGLLFLTSGLVLGLGLFVLEIPDPLRSFSVLLTYVGAQALLAVSLQQRLASTPQARPRIHKRG